MRIGHYAPAYLTSKSASFSPDLSFMYKQSNHMCRQHWRQYGIASQWLGRWICSLKVQGSRWTTSCLGIAFHFTTLSLALFVQFSVFISHMIKTKNRQHSTNKVNNLGYDRWLLNKQPCRAIISSPLFFICALFPEVSSRFIELCMQTPCLCPSEGHKHGGRTVAETSAIEFSYRNAK